MTETNERPDILFFFSDQHNGLDCGFAGHEIVETPNLDRIAERGTVFENSYTAAPLCVPARTAMLTGRLPSATGVFNNQHILPSDHATFLHSLVEGGYETVLCGRMHFKGPNQRHGFTKRICGDVTALYDGVEGVDGGHNFRTTFGMGGCVNIIGGGDSPTLSYDRRVVKAALEYLDQPHEKPQCIVVGTYGPHFPYVAPPELYEYYLQKVSLPESWNPEVSDINPMIDSKVQRTRHPVGGDRQDVTEEHVLAARAAYFGMITHLDSQIGQVRDAWLEYLETSDRKGVFVYSSDHGDTCGEHGIFGKQTFYEGSARIPVVFEGDKIPAGKTVKTPASIMDIGPTLCELSDASLLPKRDGDSLIRYWQNKADRSVICEWIQTHNDHIVPCRMIRKGKYKMMRFMHADMVDQLYNMEEDPEELNNLAESHSETVSELSDELLEGWDYQRMKEDYRLKQDHLHYLAKWDRTVHPPQEPEERLFTPEKSKEYPELSVDR